VRAVLGALDFSAKDSSALHGISNDNWRAALAFCDSAGLTIPLYLRCGDHLPVSIRTEVEQKFRNNLERWSRLKAVYSEIAGALEQNGIEFAVLKGFTQWPLFADDPSHRAQYDIDLLLKREDLERAASTVGRLGFEPGVADRSQPVVDHLPTLIRKTGWVWRGDYFDPDIPFSLELHFQCWDRDTEAFGPRDLEQTFFPRLVRRTHEEISFHALHPVDLVLYASLHTLRHVLRGNVRASHVYECAWFLHHSREDDQFWQLWRESLSDELRQYQAICFALARHWFACSLHPFAERAILLLPANITRWLLLYSHSPLASLFTPNKDELWLHWSLLTSNRQRLTVLRRRLIPRSLPGPVAALHLKRDQLSFTVQLQRHWTYFKYLCQRARHHVRSLLPTCVGAAVWMRDSWRDRSPQGQAHKP